MTAATRGDGPVATLEDIRTAGSRMVEILGLSAAPVGVRFVPTADEVPAGLRRLRHARYCQAVMEARRGEAVLLEGGQLSCPAAASAFGIRPLPEGLRSGKGLVGFGIVADPAVGASMFAGMRRLEPDSIQALELSPLGRATSVPDVVVVEDRVERLMWLALAELHVRGGERVASGTAVLQATCVDATVIPYQTGRMNLSDGCYGCRDATDLGSGEAVLGFPPKQLPAILGHLEYLHARAIPVSRSKAAWAAYRESALAEE
jgi:uncharacterized protein (DUF169 family)